MKWTAKVIGRALALQVFHRQALVIVPNTSWPGSECDLLIVRPNMKLVDVEVKISRSDLKADMGKEKWLHPWDGDWATPAEQRTRKARDYPLKIWKHYFALPEDVWKDGLEAHIAPVSGIIVMRAHRDGSVGAWVQRQAKPNRGAPEMSAADLIDIARLASLRMWEAYAEMQRLLPASNQEVKPK